MSRGAALRFCIECHQEVEGRTRPRNWCAPCAARAKIAATARWRASSKGQVSLLKQRLKRVEARQERLAVERVQLLRDMKRLQGGEE